jgi:hypothetical protein
MLQQHPCTNSTAPTPGRGKPARDKEPLYDGSAVSNGVALPGKLTPGADSLSADNQLVHGGVTGPICMVWT